MKHLLCERSWNGLHSFNCVNKKLGKVRRRCGGRWESLVQASRGHFVFAFAIWTALSVAQRSRPSWLGSAVANPDHGPGDRFNGKHWTPALQLKGKGIFNQSNVAHKKQCRVVSYRFVYLLVGAWSPAATPSTFVREKQGKQCRQVANHPLFSRYWTQLLHFAQ